VVATVGLSAIVCAVVAAQWSGMKAQDRAAFHAASASLTGGILAQFAIAVLGVLVITNEYGSGTIRTTFAATPQRVTVLAAKTLVFAVAILGVTAAACFSSFFIGQAILGTKGIGIGIGAPNALRTVVGTALYLTTLGLLSLGLGTLIRKTAGAITAVVGVLFILPVLAGLLPSSMDTVQKFLPSNAGQAIIDGGSNSDGVHSLAPWIGLGVFALYAVILLAAGAFSVVRRDA
jgi:ABC-type transport system involved in multi-copper enzyme maturation permease subunit